MAIHIPVHLYCHFFFFNDPATTEIYTPSLHDALPILAEEAQAQRTERIVLQARRGTLSDRHGTPLAVTQETYHVGIDRKSTRLNSSHLVISYAVFCLKKKTKAFLRHWLQPAASACVPV